MNDDELDTLLRGAVRHDPSRAGDALRTAGPDLLEEIMNAPVPNAPAPSELTPVEVGTSTPPPPRRRPRGLVVAAVAAAVAAIVAIPALVFGGGDSVTPAASLGLVEDPNGTRVLVDEAGWTITYAQQYRPDTWELQLTRGSDQLQINAYPADQWTGYLDDRHRTAQTPTVPVLGVEGPLIEEGKDDWEAFVPARHGQMLDIRGGLPKAEFVDLLTRLRRVSDDTWEQAMPENFVTPGREKQVAAEMLSDVPMPPGLRAKELTPGLTNVRYQFGVVAVGKVVCRWIELDLKARADHDAKAQSTADEALAGSRDWAELHEMKTEGDWPDAVWQYADALTKGTPVPGGQDDLSVAGTYRDALGCE